MMRRRSAARRPGAVAPLMCVCVLLLISVAALVLDGGLLMYQRHRAQSASDAAALAAADSLFYHYPANAGLDPNGAAKQAAAAVASADGFSGDGVASTVTVNIPPASGSFAGKAGYAEVIIQVYQARSFSAIWGSGSLPVQARSVARGQWASFGNGIITLDPSMPKSLSLGGGGLVYVQNASVIVDSSDSVAAYSGGGSIASSSEFDIVGGYGVSSGGAFLGPVYTGSSPVPDPLAYLPQPDPSTMTVQSSKKLSISGGSVTLQPGVYTGGIQISGNASVVLSPGIYYMNGGGFSFGGGGSTGGSLTGSGVMLYNNPASGSNSDTISITGNSSSVVNLSPPTSGIYQGMSIFQNRTANQTLKVTGNGNFTITGTFYAAAAPLAIAGNGAVATIGSQYVSDSLGVSGGGQINISWNSNGTARTRYLGLVE